MAVINPINVRADDLRYLLAVARSGSMVTAAKALGVDHTTVARRIRVLEKSLGHRLLDRGSEGWELTSIGLRVVDTSRPVDNIIAEVVNVVSSDGDDALHGTVRVNAPDGFEVAFVVPAMQKVRVLHPHLHIELLTAARPLSLRGSGFDIAITIGTPTGSRLVSEELTVYSMRLYATRDYLDSHSPIVTAESLKQHALVFYIDSMQSIDDLDLGRYFSEMEMAISSTNVLAQVAATQAGAGIGLLPAFLGEPLPDLVPVLPDVFDFRLNFSLSARRESVGLASTRAIRASLMKEVRERHLELLPAVVGRVGSVAR